MYSVYFWQVLWYVLVRSEKLARIWHVFVAQNFHIRTIYVPITYQMCARLTYGFWAKNTCQMHAIMVFVCINGIYNVYILYV